MSASTRLARRRRPRCRVQIEPLEDRLLLSLDLLGQWNAGTPLYSDGWVVDGVAFIGHYGNNNGVHVIDVTDPTNPTQTARIPIGDIRDIEAQWQYYNGDWHLIGYFSSDIGNGLYIWDVSDPWNPVQLSRITAAQNGFNSVHTLSVEGDWLYEADSRTSTVRVFDVSNPASPRFVRTIVSPIGDSVHEVTVQWGRLYTAGIFGRSSAEIWDVSRLAEPGAPVSYLGRIDGPALRDRAHTTWPTDDGSFMAVAREIGGGDLSFWDITNPASPQLVWRMDLREPGGCCVHQVMIRGNLLFSSWYTAGIYVHDISDPYNPVEVGHYDTFPGPGNGYNGAWGVFGYWWDNRVFAFDMQSGMFIFQLNPDGSPGQSPGAFEGTGSRAVRGRAAEGRDLSAFTRDQIAQLDGDVLTLTLSAAADTVTASRSADGRSLEIVINDTLRFSYDANRVRRLNVRALEGNDRIVLDPNLNVHLFIDAGPGEDVVEGWSEFYVNPSPVYQGTIHSPKVSRYLTLGAERVLNAPSDKVNPNLNPIDYSAHQLIEHAETTEGLTGLEGLAAANHLSFGMAASLALASASLTHGPTAAPDHFFGMAKQVAWHKPWCT